MLFKTEGIVLHVIRYRETSVIVKIFTDLFGIQSYIVNGVRSSKARAAKGNLLQPGNILELVVYHREQKNLQRISEYKAAFIYKNLYGNIVKNTLTLYMVELLHRSLTEPEANPDLYAFARDALKWMDGHPAEGLVNLPLFFTLKTAALLGFELSGNYSEHTPYLDLQEGEFVEHGGNTFFLEKEEAFHTHHLLKIRNWDSLAAVKISKKQRNQLLSFYLDFLKLHVPGFRELKSPKILKSILH